MDIFGDCPVIENDRYRLRKVTMEDAEALLTIYADKRVLPFFNSDNCGGNNFYYPTVTDMQECITFWEREYQNRVYVRMAIIDKTTDKIVGTTELFVRHAEDYFTECFLLRLDLCWEYEEASRIGEIVGLILRDAKEYFNYSFVAVKAPIYAVERIAGLKHLGFRLSEKCVINHERTRMYDGYWVLR